MTPPNSAIPDAYVGREQALIKHALLKGYLEKLFLIIGSSSPRLGIAELCYVDCFAGPWDVDDDEWGSTSIAISLGILARCRNQLEKNGRRHRVRALFIERDPTAFARLEAYLAEKTPPGIEATALRGDFLELRRQVLDWCGEKAFTFFFVDPTGWIPVTIENLQPLLARPKSEFLVTFVYDWINRTASMPEWQERVTNLLGEPLTLTDLDPAQREKAILDAYRRNLCVAMAKEANRPPRSAYVRVLDPAKERPKYHLVYLTRHARGIVEFMETSQGVDIVQREVRAAKKDEARATRWGTPDMFGSESYIDDGKDRLHGGEVEQYWLEYLRLAGRQVGELEFAEMLEETNWFPIDFQSALGRLIDRGAVRNHNAKRHRAKKPLHWDKKGEFLELVKLNP